jgi:hypothetical protein
MPGLTTAQSRALGRATNPMLALPPVAPGGGGQVGHVWRGGVRRAVGSGGGGGLLSSSCWLHTEPWQATSVLSRCRCSGRAGGTAQPPAVADRLLRPAAAACAGAAAAGRRGGAAGPTPPNTPADHPSSSGRLLQPTSPLAGAGRAAAQPKPSRCWAASGLLAAARRAAASPLPLFSTTGEVARLVGLPRWVLGGRRAQAGLGAQQAAPACLACGRAATGSQ